MGCHQYTTASNSTTLESNKSVPPNRWPRPMSKRFKRGGRDKADPCPLTWAPHRGIQGHRCGRQLPLLQAGRTTRLQHVAELVKLREQSLIECWSRVSVSPFPSEATVGALGGADQQHPRLQVHVTQVQVATVGLRTRGAQPCRQRRLLGLEHSGHAFQDGGEDPPGGHPTQLLRHFQCASHLYLLRVDATGA